MAEAEPVLLPLLAPLTGLPGVGAGIAGLIGRAIGGTRVIDLLFHLPDNTIDRRYRPALSRAEPGRIATLVVRVLRIDGPARPRQPWRVVAGDPEGGPATLELVFFSPHQARRLQPGMVLTVSGPLEAYGNRLSMPHPDHLVPAGPDGRPGFVPEIEAVWPLTAGLNGRLLGRAMRGALQRLPDPDVLGEWLDPALVARERWPDFGTALRTLHLPKGDPDAESRARARLGCDELLAEQVAIQQAKRIARRRPGRSLRGDGHLRAETLRRFGFRPTDAQHRALHEIDADLERPTRMLRLLQGDVGAGKTLVALLAMLRAAEAGAQSCLMAPTEILARQHYATLSRLSPVPVALLTGSIKGRARKQALEAIGTGAALLTVGTHALFQDGVEFSDLALAVIDEQHRFGVEQRLLLGDKGRATDVLVMTATPIPRTVLLTQYGEMQVSRLDGKPAGRKPIRTTLHGMGAEAEVIEAVRRALARDAQLFWVCPLVEESELLDIQAAQRRFAALDALFPGRVGLAHGRQDPAIRQAALDRFASGQTRILVATTVIEVGVDIPSATIMVIEHAERFGLAQLHQLRGRVGRGAEASYCLLLHDEPLGAGSRRRLSLLRDTEDGFLIADEDYRMRGGGELMGRRQSGQAGYRLAGGTAFERLLRTAWQDAERLVERDGALQSARGRTIRRLLALFGKADAARTLGSG
ncbi:ATP-dependent DNA helicase RecG [Endosaccharibacter trunci]|uniref:ATP-dependent DNA helicase RecG n=1 Tax=Endosaccharibacter trunci TaxID=2812733 RepID=UPI003BF5FE7E